MSPGRRGAGPGGRCDGGRSTSGRCAGGCRDGGRRAGGRRAGIPDDHGAALGAGTGAGRIDHGQAVRDLFDRSLEIGVSGHLGDRKLAFVGGTVRQGNGAVALDATLPLPWKLAVKGEVFWGKGLDAFSGGIAQGIAHTTDAAGNITSIGDGIAAVGGWGQASWAALEWLTLYAGAGADDPSRDDLLKINAVMNRTLNVTCSGAIAAQLAHGIALWLEYDFLHTDFQAAPAVQTHVLALTGQVTL